MMKKLALMVLLVAGSILVFQSCKVEKRLHRPGYHVEWAHKKPRNHNVVREQERGNNSNVTAAENHSCGIGSQKTSPSMEARFFSDDDVEALALNPSHSGAVMVATQRRALWSRQCETMVLNDGRRILIFLIEIGEEEILYKRCDDPLGKVHSILRKDVDRIENPDGTRQTIEPFMPAESESSDSPEKTEKKKLESLGVGSMVLSLFPWIALFAGNSILFLIVFFVVTAIAFALSIASIQRFKAQPNRFIGLGFAITGLIISVLALVFLFLILITII